MYFAFQLDITHIPSEFLQYDITEDGERHLVLASTSQLLYLAKSKLWFISYIPCCMRAISAAAELTQLHKVRRCHETSPSVFCVEITKHAGLCRSAECHHQLPSNITCCEGSHCRLRESFARGTQPAPSRSVCAWVLVSLGAGCVPSSEGIWPP